MAQNALELIRKHLSQVKIPQTGDSVYKEECVYSFDTPESPDGLFVNLSTFRAVGKDYLKLDHEKTNQCLYLRQKWTKVIDEEPQESTDAKPTKMAIGGPDGFQVDQEKFHFEKEHDVYVFPEGATMSCEHEDLPMGVKMSVDAILAMDDASKAVAVEQWEEKRPVSKYAEDLPQLDTGFKLSPDPKDWKCYDSGMTENLWLNLSTGIIGSGRQNWDGTGGTGAALKHFEETGKKYPLTVKLGTITPQGADVFSYADDENDMVEDSKLAEHLAHWGIDMMKMQKTEKTMTELDIELNMSYDFDRLTEAGSEKKPLEGAGFVGLRNLGNSCYCNTVYQVLFSLPPLQQRYAHRAQEIFSHASSNPAENLTVQLAKLGEGLCTERYTEPGYIAPQMVKGLLGQGHPEFSTNQQQDALEYFQHVLTRITRADQANHELDHDITRHFRFEVETRLQCNATQQVRYATHEENVLSLTIPVEAATNHAEVLDYQAKLAEGAVDKSAPPVRHQIPFDAILNNFSAEEEIQDFLSPATNVKGTASKTVRFKTFPDFLMVHLRRYVLSDNWVPKKLEAEIPLPEKLSLEALRGHGLLPNETELPEEPAGGSSNDQPQPDAAIMEQLAMMGFGSNACARACLGVHNSSAEAATNWLMEHMGDADINDPLPSGNSSGGAEVNEESLAMLISMGIDPSHARNGLKETGGDMERAVDWCFSHDPVSEIQESAQESQAATLPTGAGEYKLKAIISHIGSNLGSGHYVCHILKNGQWALFNDRKVCESQNPPLDMGYLYLYARSE